ncbi:MAG TPA: hypothetical protein VGD55_01170 [Acidothermaceae bacterium]
MKLATFSVSTFFLLTSAMALAQSPSPASSEPETLTAGTSPGGTKITGWFLAPTFGTTGFDGRLNYTPGVRGGIYLNKRFAVGIAAQGLASSASTLNHDEVRNLGSYGGLLLQYIWHSDQLFHGTLESTIGNGRWCAAGTGGSDSCATKGFLVFEPAANIELNVAKHVRFASGVGYRFAAAGSGEGPSSHDMSSLVVRTSLIFGSF